MTKRKREEVEDIVKMRRMNPPELNVDQWFVNTNLKPSETIIYPWLYCESMEKKQRKLLNPGKWMLFYPKSALDEKWKIAQWFFHSGKLEGVDSMKVATNMDKRTNFAPIIFYCEKSDEEERIKRIGTKIAQEMKYTHKNGYIYYKSDEQTIAGLTNPNAKKSLYRVAVPKKLS